MRLKSLGALIVGSAVMFGFIVAREVISPEELGIRKAPVENEVVNPSKFSYPQALPGQAKRFLRAYENAPPQIPHSIEGLFSITLKNNACLNCHIPDVAKQIGATPLLPTIDFYHLP